MRQVYYLQLLIQKGQEPFTVPIIVVASKWEEDPATGREGNHPEVKAWMGADNNIGWGEKSRPFPILKKMTHDHVYALKLLLFWLLPVMHSLALARLQARQQVKLMLPSLPNGKIPLFHRHNDHNCKPFCWWQALTFLINSCQIGIPFSLHEIDPLYFLHCTSDRGLSVNKP